ncbi:MAG: PKD domain-containing protein [Clostridiaceae bacterium]|nr:PKD domain-containing protein [Clostridiaceae bacterium]
MDNRVIAEKYEIIDTLFSNELQSIYLAKISGSEDSNQFIINEFKDADTIYGMKDSFSKEKCRHIRSIVETLYENFCFYVVCNICPGPTMEAFLSDNSLRLTDKMFLTDSLLSQLIDIEKLSPFIVYSLCDIDNIAVTNKRHICFNCNLKFTPETMAVSRSDVSRKAGEIICAIFSNTAAADLNYAKDNMPPALFPIVQSCLEGKYESMAKLYNDFKTLLLYSVFMGGGSVDNQIRANYQKAKVRRKLTPVRRLAALVLILLLAGGAWMFATNRGIFTFNKNAVNTKPAAEFTASKIEVYEGEKVLFTDQSSDPDEGDGIKSYLWVISKSGDPIFNSNRQGIAYTFVDPGKFEVSLVVTDTRGETSEPASILIDVLQKLELPEPAPGSEDENNK